MLWHKPDDCEFNFEISNDRLKPIADALIAKYDELSHIRVQYIVFVINHTSRDKKVRLAKTSRIPVKWTELLFQLGAVSYLYTMEFYAKTTATMDESQIVALVYRELRKIGREGDILTYDVQDWWQILMGLGRKWFYPDQTCPNLLDDSISWEKLMGGLKEDAAS